jgi:hypothetical protein
MGGFREGLRAIVVMIDRSKGNDAHQMLMVSLRVGQRALPRPGA